MYKKYPQQQVASNISKNQQVQKIPSENKIATAERINSKEQQKWQKHEDKY